MKALARKVTVGNQTTITLRSGEKGKGRKLFSTKYLTGQGISRTDAIVSLKDFAEKNNIDVTYEWMELES
jgi:hypothetical protein